MITDVWFMLSALTVGMSLMSSWRRRKRRRKVCIIIIIMGFI